MPRSRRSQAQPPSADALDELVEIEERLKACLTSIPGTYSTDALGRADNIAARDVRVEFLRRRVDELRRWLDYRKSYISEPVSFEVFLKDPQYLGIPEDQLWPKVVACGTELNSGRYYEAVLTGGIGCAKTTLAIWTQLYQIYLLSLLADPHKTLEMIPSDEIVFILQSTTASAAKAVDYQRMRNLCEASPYFRDHFRYEREIESELHFPHKIIVRPVSSKSTASIGQNVIGGILDEINFRAMVEKSKVTRGETLDAAWQSYNSLSSRRESRFMRRGNITGVVCLVSSRQYPGEFTEKKIDEATGKGGKEPKPGIYVYDKRIWEVAPADRFRPERFRLFLGTPAKRPRLVPDDEVLDEADEPHVMMVPLDYKPRFEADIMNAIREVAGMATVAKHPFFGEPEKVTKAFGRVKSAASREGLISRVEKVTFKWARFREPKKPRFLHIDLAKSSDSAGFACGWCSGFERVMRGATGEWMPKIEFDFVLEVRPPPGGGEIDFEWFREVIYEMTKHGVNAKWVTADTYQSVDMLQQLSRKGYTTGEQSMDRTITPYAFARQAIYDGRAALPAHERAAGEIVALEVVPLPSNRGVKVDHPTPGSKDCSDAIAGVIYGLTCRKTLWYEHGISMRDIPNSLIEAIEAGKRSIAAQEGQDGLHQLAA